MIVTLKSHKKRKTFRYLSFSAEMGYLTLLTLAKSAYDEKPPRPKVTYVGVDPLNTSVIMGQNVKCIAYPLCSSG
jgi:hypothetical protein